MSAPLPEAVRAFLDRPLHATVVTIDADGSPHAAVVWYERDGDAILVNSAHGRRWPDNLLRDPRATIVVGDGADWLSVRGRVSVDDDPERALADIIRLAHRYDPHGAEERASYFRTQRRVTFRLLPDRIHSELAED